MPALVTKKFRTHNAKQFIESLDEPAAFGGSSVSGPESTTSLDDHIYLFIGKTDAWPDENVPPSPSDNDNDNIYDHWRDMIAAKKVTSGDVSHVIPRYNWTSGTTYSQYDHTDTTLHTDTASPFYVITDDFHVYKCLDNANNAISTVQPISVSTEAGAIDDKTGADNYKWKYLYTVTAAEALKFVTPNYIPVKTIRNANSVGQTGTTGMPTDDGTSQYDIEVNSTDGSIDVYNITTTGSNYKFIGGTISAGATTTQFTATTEGLVAQNDYYNDSGVFISNTVCKITDYSHDNINTGTITISPALSSAPASGSTYKIFPQIKIYGDGTGATARAVEGVTTGTLGAIFSAASGTGYTFAEIKVVQASATGGTGGVVSPVISSRGGHGYDCVEELGGNFVMINSRLEQSESGKFTTSNDFRKLGLIKNPNFANGTNRFTTTAATQAMTMGLKNVSGTNFIADAIITGGDTTATTSGATAIIVDIADGSSSTQKILTLVNVDFGPNSANKLLGVDAITGSNLVNPQGGPALSGNPGGFVIDEDVTVSASTARIETLTAGDMQPYSGSILYIENRSPVVRAADQTEDIKLIIEF